MKTRHSLILGLIASSLMLALPAQAEHGLPAGAFLIAKRSADDASRSERADDRRRDERRASGGQNERGYGYGYERRQRDPETEESAADPRRRDREQRNERSEDRGSRSGRR